MQTVWQLFDILLYLEMAKQSSFVFAYVCAMVATKRMDKF